MENIKYIIQLQKKIIDVDNNRFYMHIYFANDDVITVYKQNYLFSYTSYNGDNEIVSTKNYIHSCFICSEIYSLIEDYSKITMIGSNNVKRCRNHPLIVVLYTKDKLHNLQNSIKFLIINRGYETVRRVVEDIINVCKSTGNTINLQLLCTYRIVVTNTDMDLFNFNMYDNEENELAWMVNVPVKNIIDKVYSIINNNKKIDNSQKSQRFFPLDMTSIVDKLTSIPNGDAVIQK